MITLWQIFLTFYIITFTYSKKHLTYDPEFFRHDIEKILKNDFDVTITPFGNYARNVNNTPVILAEQGNQIYLSCEVQSHPRLKSFTEITVSWKHNGKPLGMPPPYPIPWSHGSILMVRPLRDGRNGGYYECIGTMQFIMRDQVFVTVRREVLVKIRPSHMLPKGFPKIIQHPKSIISPREKVDFNCIVSGESPVQIVWYRNRKPVSTDHTHISSMAMVGKNFSSNLMIKNATKDDQGFYQCLAFNKYGQAASRQATINFKKALVKKVRKKRNTFTNFMGQHIRGNCSGGRGNGVEKSKYPDPIILKSVDCESTPQDGLYLNFLWTIGQQITKNITNLVVSLFANSTTILCFNLKGGARNFKFTKKEGFNIYTEYSVAIVPHPNREEVKTIMHDIPRDYCRKPPEISTTPMLLGEEDEKLKDNYDNDGDGIPTWTLFVVFGSIAAIVCIGLLGVVVYKQWQQEQAPSPACDADSNDIYVSHCSMKKTDQNRVFNFFMKLHSYDVKVNSDLLNLTFISSNGGLCKWIPEVISTAKRIIMIITPAYLKVIKGAYAFKNQEEVLKVQAEYNHIQGRLFHKASVDPAQVILLVDSRVNKEEIPAPLFLCPKYSYSKILQNDESELMLLLGVLKNMETISYEA